MKTLIKRLYQDLSRVAIPCVLLVWFSEHYIFPILNENIATAPSRFVPMTIVWLAFNYAWYMAYWRLVGLFKALIRYVRRR